VSALTAAFTPAAVFDAATFIVLPLYAAMVLAPKLRLTRRVMSGDVFYWAAAAVYAGLLALWQVAPHAVNTVKLMGLSHLALPDVRVFATFFASPHATALAWVHLVVLDLFQARYNLTFMYVVPPFPGTHVDKTPRLRCRWVYADGLRERVPTPHSIILCFMAGPLGLVTHVVTKALVGAVRRRGGAVEDPTIMYRF
jgi:Domain of unknown function (DUF4281)